MNGSTSSEERDSQLSAMFDGELSGGECELIARRLARDPALRRKWARHALVGAVVRGEREVVVGEGFALRVSAAIAAEPACGEDSPQADGRPGAAQPGTLARWRRPLAAAGVAASVAAISILLLRAGPAVAPGGTLLAASAPKASEPAPGARAVGLDAASYVVPAPSRTRALGLPAAQLANYVVAHSEFSSPLGRRNLLSALMAGESVPPPAPAAGVADGSALNESAGAVDAAR